MNIRKLLRLASPTLLLLLFCLSLQAQTAEIYIVDATSPAGETVGLEVRAVRLAAAVGVQVSLQWDPELLEYVTVEDIVKEGSLGGNFNQTQVDSGRIGYFFYDEALNGIGTSDSSLLFRLMFRPLEGAGMEADITFGDAPIRTVISDRSNDSIPTVFTPGTVSIGTTSTRLPAYADDARLTASPNPFSGSTGVSFDLGYRGEGRFEIIDLSGRIILRRSVRIAAGKNEFTLEAGEFPAPGSYILRLITEREQLHRRVILASPHR